MQRSKKIFLVLSAIFLIIMIIIGYDISRRTSFPGANSDEEIHQAEGAELDSLKTTTE